MTDRPAPRTAAALLMAAACGGCYLAEQGVGQARLLLARQPLEAARLDGRLSHDQRSALGTLKDAQRFGVERLGLAGEELYRSLVDTGGRPVAWNVSASRKDRFEAHTWWFPVVGTVPYLGFFDRGAAEAEAARLGEDGLDVNLRGVGAYSTLGWFDDPVFSSSLDGDAFDVARLVLHEMAHATLFFPGEVAWNENFATLVGDRGALAWAAARLGPRAEAAAETRLAAEAAFEAYLTGVVERLAALYGSDLPAAEKLSRREVVFDEGKRGLAELLRRHPEARREAWLEREWNNAVLLSFSRYRADQAAWRRALDARFGGDLAALVAHCRKRDAPWQPGG